MRNRKTQQFARILRREATDAENFLWRHLRRKHIAGYRFRRQVPIRGYIADFACVQAKLIIELDGGQHREQFTYDRHRDRQMEALGFHVLRFWDHQVFQEMEAVLNAIFAALQSRSKP